MQLPLKDYSVYFWYSTINLLSLCWLNQRHSRLPMLKLLDRFTDTWQPHVSSAKCSPVTFESKQWKKLYKVQHWRAFGNQNFKKFCLIQLMESIPVKEIPWLYVSCIVLSLAFDVSCLHWINICFWYIYVGCLFAWNCFSHILCTEVGNFLCCQIMVYFW